MVALRAPRPVFLTAATALVVCLAYYVGAHLGLILRFPPATPSVMWPPNAILTATLLLAPPRRWWIYLLAAFPAHLAAELGASGRRPWCWGCSSPTAARRSIAAVGVRWFSDGAPRASTPCAGWRCSSSAAVVAGAVPVLVSRCGRGDDAAGRAVLGRLEDPILLQRPDRADAGAGARDGGRDPGRAGSDTASLARRAEAGSSPWPC